VKKSFVPIIPLLFLSTFFTQAQSTYQQVYNLFQTKCTASCHSGTTPTGNLNLSGNETDVYNRLINVMPTNPAAAGKGYKLVAPGYPYRSLLMRKINHGLDSQNELTIAEGVSMPNNSDTLSNEQRELIRQWIIWGARDTGTFYNASLIHDYYANGGIPETTAPLTPAQEGREGYQVKFGPIFLQPLGEFEFFQVYEPEQAISKEITELHSVLPPQAHHWALRTISQAGANALGVAPKAGADFNTQILVFQYTKFLAIWQFTDDLVFPQGTAHFQDSSEALLLNLHMHNYSTTQILPSSAYLNVYTQPMGSGAVEMKTEAHSYGGTNPFLLQIPNTGMPFTLQDVLVVPGETRYFWNIQSHTHALGTDYDMFLRNADGTKGNQFYEGFYNENYTYNQGYYDYTHPAVETFNPLMEVNMDKGLIFEATWVNNGPDTMGFGLTTKEEMFVTYYQYTNELPTAVKETDRDALSLSVVPNPGKDNFRLSYSLKSPGLTKIELYNAMGEKVKMIFAGEQAAGKQFVPIDISKDGLAPGLYFVRVAVDGYIGTKQVIVIQ
jgi:hypothetical protein